MNCFGPATKATGPAVAEGGETRNQSMRAPRWTIPDDGETYTIFSVVSIASEKQ